MWQRSWRRRSTCSEPGRFRYADLDLDLWLSTECMEKRVDAYAVQFLSRDCVPDDLTGTYEGVPFAGAPFSFEMTLRKGGGTALLVRFAGEPTRRSLSRQ